MKKRLISFVVIGLIASSCATLFTGTKDKIAFKTTPDGAMVYIDGLEQCKTPCTIDVKRKLGDTDVEIKLDGFETRVISLDKELNVISIINLGNLLGWGIDALSGAIMKYDRKAYDIELKKDKKTAQINPVRVNVNTDSKIVEVFVVSK